VKITPEEWFALSKLFDDALDRAPGDREHWLNSLPKQHASLRDSLRKMLATHAAIETGDFLQTLAKFPTAGSSFNAALKRGAVVGPYVLDEEIGSGGMGTVWRAHRVDGMLKRDVALKLPHAGLFTPQIAHRFILERDILAGLAHINIARLYDAGTADNGQPYLALEYIEGVPITEYCDRQHLDIRGRIELAIEMLEAVRYAHSHLVIHRDLKPSNILVTNDSQVRLLDFGIAKLLPSDKLSHAVMTEIGARALTPDYAAPEHITGGVITTATDVYSAGVVLYELLTGQRPYRLPRNSLGALESAIVESEPIRPSRAEIFPKHATDRSTTIKKLRQQLSGDLDTILLKALKKSPQERYATIDAFLQDVQSYLHNRPVLARPDSRWYVAKKFVARHRLPMSIGAIALSAVIVATTLALVEARQATVERDRALRMSERSEAVADFLNTMVTQAAQSEKPVTVNAMLERSEKLADVQYGQDPDNRAAVLRMLGEYYFSRDDYVRAEALLRKAQATAQASSDWSLRAAIGCSYGPPVARLGHREEAIRSLRAIVDDPRTGDKEAVICLISLSYVTQQANDYAETLRNSLQAQQRMERIKIPSPFMEAMVLGAIADAERLGGRNDLASQYFAKSIGKFSEAGREHSVEALTMRNNWSLVNDSAGDPKAGLSILEQVIDLSAANETDAPPNLFFVANRARMLYSIGRYRDSIDAFQDCLKRANGFLLAFCSIAIAADYEEIGDLDSARRYLAEAEPIVKATSAPTSSVALGFDIARGKLAAIEHHYDAAHRFLSTVIDAHKKNGSTPTAYTLRAELNLENDQLSNALDDAHQALALGRELQGGKPYSNRTGLAYFALAKILEKQGNVSEAKSALESAVWHLSNTVDPSHPALLQARQLLSSRNDKKMRS